MNVLFVFSIFILFGFCWSKCIWYDSGCGGRKLNCVYEGAPIPLESEKAMQNLAELCPDLAEFGNSTGICCSEKQLRTMKSKMSLAGFLISDCPSCFRNFRQIFCQSTCSPDQDKFMRIDDTKEKSGKVGIVAATYFISEPVLFNTISSCNKLYGYLSGYAINNLCGTSDVTDCSPHKLARFLSENAPFKLNITVLKNGQRYNDSNRIYEGAHPRTIPCNENTPEGHYFCTRGDCHYENSYHGLDAVALGDDLEHVPAPPQTTIPVIIVDLEDAPSPSQTTSPVIIVDLEDAPAPSQTTTPVIIVDLEDAPSQTTTPVIIVDLEDAPAPPQTTTPVMIAGSSRFQSSTLSIQLLCIAIMFCLYQKLN